MLMTRSPTLSLLDLLVTVSGMLSSEDYGWVGPVIWQECLSGPDSAILSAVSAQVFKAPNHAYHRHLGMLRLYAIR